MRSQTCIIPCTRARTGASVTHYGGAALVHGAAADVVSAGADAVGWVRVPGHAGSQGGELFAAQFSVGWRAYSAFNTALPGATDVQARTYIAGWLAAAKLGAVDEVSVTGLHAS